MTTDDGTRWVICYDIPDDKRRTKVAKTLDSYGDRVQFSVFEALLDRRLFAAMMSKLEPLLDPKEDTLRAYPLCAGCVKRQVKIGVGANDTPPGEEHVFVV